MLIVRPVIGDIQRPLSSLLHTNMSRAGDSDPASKREDNHPHTEADADSDEEVFHDARFPAEEEAVSSCNTPRARNWTNPRDCDRVF